jgi:methyltransferase (TIGR00027 family)
LHNELCKGNLIKDSKIKNLTANMTNNDKITVPNLLDYPNVRSHYIEEKLLRPWCFMHQKSQIILLGAGYDTRAYRFKPLKTHTHTIFEIDFPIIIHNKEKILKNKKPFCLLKRLSADLRSSEWPSHLFKSGFSSDIPTLWVLEGLVYYMKLEEFSHLLTQAADISEKNSQIFVDIIHGSQGDASSHNRKGVLSDPFSKPPNWVLNNREIHSFFAGSGWNVSFSFADKNHQDQDSEKRGMIFINGKKTET